MATRCRHPERCWAASRSGRIPKCALARCARLRRTRSTVLRETPRTRAIDPIEQPSLAMRRNTRSVGVARLQRSSDREVTSEVVGGGSRPAQWSTSASKRSPTFCSARTAAKTRFMAVVVDHVHTTGHGRHGCCPRHSIARRTVSPATSSASTGGLARRRTQGTRCARSRGQSPWGSCSTFHVGSESIRSITSVTSSSGWQPSNPPRSHGKAVSNAHTPLVSEAGTSAAPQYHRHPQ